ncbi:tumor necrosis factor receptor superfamily member 14 isoform X2 [Ursus maritimus]|uniref:Tumor necrosis factor receptor superfamily member 14 isoform X2 n=1 Tax=Ursus maritimus TaxID=29073 RepID=A0A384DG54_URSMA|nr:tumor necrosis factor receptor superfamily member 14 isoform X2 [Ursus maritimus]
MEPLRGWEPPPWSLTPKADALHQALYLLLLGSLPCALAMAPCKEEEYPVGSECCPKCSPGYRVKEACGELTGTLCVPCDPGTYTAHLNGLSECLQCRVCDPGTERQDRVCEDCPSGTFSPSGTLEECQPWTTCSGPFQTEAEPGTSSSDITCSSRGLYVFVGSLVLIGVLCGLIVLGIRMKNRRSPGGPTKARLFHQVPRAPPDITTVALEETASVSPVSLPCVTGRE